ncbi:TlpA family protein disulfide reductase [Chryseobacterium polytrichastri]|uniref:AhpC/TSA family protein n=1 Tax=Chryseobacterium polytrichastri TaxID=1302687 RepID=A0A1M6PKW1_9FLAO|nr:TlpA disulfide reductase family protein [Chryseobacterium polytrichastri]SHK08571.1 AhpC/TSA family protein [Chryseobacterium polytrichastri]
MRKIILSTIVLVALSSCKKESQKTDDNANSTDSVTVSQNTEPASSALPLKVLTTQQASDYLKTKNDTLYVTNFFATWCGPCVKEIPHFKEKIAELKGKPVKITFVSVDNKDVWNTDVPRFVDEHGIRENTLLLDGKLLDANFFKSNFTKWDGSAIPFTYMRKGDKTEESLGMITPEELDSKIKSLLK